MNVSASKLQLNTQTYFKIKPSGNLEGFYFIVIKLSLLMSTVNPVNDVRSVFMIISKSFKYVSISFET